MDSPCDMAARFPEGMSQEHHSRTPSGSCVASHALVLEVPGHHLCHILQLKQVTKASPGPREWNQGPSPMVGEEGLTEAIFRGSQLLTLGIENWDKFRELLHP